MEAPKKQKYQDILDSFDKILLDSWTKIQNNIKSNLIFESPKDFNPKYLAGVDISFSKINPQFCASTIAIFNPLIELVGLKTIISKNEVPYLPGFLAFREVDSLKKCFDLVVKKYGEKIENFRIDLIFVDGNGILHPRECGLACHLGFILNVPSIGCAKTLFAIDGINKHKIEEIKKEFQKIGNKYGNFEPLIGNSNKIWGAAVKNSKNAFDPLIVSTGHLMDLKQAVEWTIKCSKKRVVEPIRVADHHSRFIISQFELFYSNKYKQGIDEDLILIMFQQEIDQKFDEPEYYKDKYQS